MNEAILVVDDDPLVERCTVMILHHLGYTTFSAHSEDEAYEEWHRHLPEIKMLMTDINMPEETGDHLALRLLSERPDLKVLFMSGSDAASISSAIPLREGENLLAKPFSTQELSRALANVLAQVE